MGLDIYVGPMSRYYAGRWETIIGQWAGSMVTIEGSEPASEEDSSVEACRAIEVKTDRKLIQPPSMALTKVNAWIAGINQVLTSLGRGPIEWTEELDGSYHTDKPGWIPYNALQLWAAYDVHRDLSLPSTLPESLHDDPAYRRSTEPSFEGLYTSFLGVELWLPGLENISFVVNDVTGVRRRVAFTRTLLLELEDLNGRTWEAGIEDIKAWGWDPPASDASLDEHAKFAFSLLFRLGHAALNHEVPMILDY